MYACLNVCMRVHKKKDSHIGIRGVGQAGHEEGCVAGEQVRLM